LPFTRAVNWNSPFIGRCMKCPLSVMYPKKVLRQKSVLAFERMFAVPSL
jgi:hypothetical protein